ncbi:hypothetical protein P7K49_031478 [Saguinus oedipus]|uniref:SWAP70 N-terminal EF-hand domain-containing protein n=1 Tax=Saguinus oedipus TaxID=9490 RepID=A0ABQ9TZJ1_SAGOE|nr:hypothetical protein P7K49_031478 [Saguinus oedipus]
MTMGSLRDELLKAIWHAFTALYHDHSGQVSESQLKVLSHNLCMVLKVPHDPVALEEHFRDNDEGPVSNQGYMPYLNKFILKKVQHNFDKIEFNRIEDLNDKKGDILLDENCCLESLPDKDGKKCLFLVKCFDKTFEIGASDKKKKQEWIKAIHSTIHLLKLGSPPPHKEA